MLVLLRLDFDENNARHARASYGLEGRTLFVNTTVTVVHAQQSSRFPLRDPITYVAVELRSRNSKDNRMI